MSQKYSHYTYTVAACLLSVLLVMGYLVLDYFCTARDSLAREANAVLAEVFRQDFSIRHRNLKSNEHSSPDVFIDLIRKRGHDNVDLSKDIDLVINTVTERVSPQNIRTLDSLALLAFQKRHIDTDLYITRLNRSGKVIAYSDNVSEYIFFKIMSDPLPVNLSTQESIQLTLLNPFGVIVKRMAWVIAISLLFSIVCIVLFTRLIRVLAKQKQLLEMKNDFFGNTAHELKRPLARLRIAIDSLVSEKLNNSQEMTERFRAISIDAVREMTNGINVIMTLSMAEEGVFNLNITRFNLSRTINELKEEFTIARYGKKVINIDSDLPEYFFWEGDDIHIRQALANLIDNAIKYSDKNVEISIRAVKEKRNVRLTVSDNGWGIPLERQEEVFEKYTRLHTKGKSLSGFGIGLNYVKTVVEKHGGKISLISLPNEGSQFIITLPMVL